MSENSNETANNDATSETTTVESAKERPAGTSCCKPGSCCTPHASIIISFIALILAGYAVYSSTQSRDNSAVESRIAQLENQTSGISEQITSLDAQIKSNRENLIQTKLKKALQNIQDIGNLAGEGTKAAITEVEKMLKTLTSISKQLDTPAASIESGSEPAAEPDSEPANAPESTPPAEIAQPEATQSESTQAEPAAEPTAPDSSATKPSPATTETTPTQPADASSVAPTDNQAASDSPPADTTPASEPSAPQAF